MIRRLKSLGVRLWVTGLLALPGCFILLPRLNQMGIHVPAGIPAALVVVLIFALVHLALDRLGRQLVRSLMEEGRTWERAGLTSRSGRAYIRAMGIFDSYLYSPWVGRGNIDAVTGVLARFALTWAPGDPGFFPATDAHLLRFPQDETLARLFLERMLRQGRTNAVGEDILTRMAEIHHSHPQLAPLLADIFLDLGREDFAAKKVFQSVLDLPELPGAQRERILALDQFQEQTLARTAGRQQPVAREEGRSTGKAVSGLLSRTGEGGVRLFGMVFNAVMISLLWIWQQGEKLCGAAGRGLYHVWRSEKLGRYIKIGLVGGLGLWLMFFVGNTVVHLVKTSGTGAGDTVVKKMPKPFTIQVAAYLKQKHADRFVNQLKEKGISATIKKVGGGGKTWYLVRVSEFTDKASATAFGNKLKAGKIIEDFFVSNK